MLHIVFGEAPQDGFRFRDFATIVTVGSTPSWRAEAEALDGAIERALETIERALQANPVERASVCDAFRIRAELNIKAGQEHRAQADFRAAIARAQDLAAKAFKSRAAMGRARMLQGRYALSEARDFLAADLLAFTEGFGTVELTNARELLSALMQ